MPRLLKREPDFIFHLGLPRTATTTLQSYLAARKNIIGLPRIDYPTEWRDSKRIAHHELGLALAKGGVPRAPELAASLAIGAKRAGARTTIISTEYMTNLLNPDRLECLLAFLDQFRPKGSFRLVIALRRLDEFIESMFLQDSKAGTGSTDLESYVAKRKRFADDLFSSISRLKRSYGSNWLLQYRDSPQFWEDMSQAMNIPEIETEVPRLPRQSERLTLKAHTILANIDEVERVLQLKLDRWQLIGGFLDKRLSFEEDTKRFRIIPWSLATEIAESAASAAATHGIRQYVSWFGKTQLPEYEAHDLHIGRINDDDLQRLASYAGALPARLPTTDS
jgi:hypothetical protein